MNARRGRPVRASCAFTFLLLADVAFAAPGELHAPFGTDGFFRTQGGATVRSAVQNDGRIVFVTTRGPGRVAIDGPRDVYVRRLLPNGSIDPSFGGPRGTHFGFGAGATEVAFAVALQSDGRILIAGQSFPDFKNTFVSDAYIARLNPDGSLDAMFGGDGKVEIDFGTTQESAAALTVQADGKIVVAGTAAFTGSGSTSGSLQYAIARLNVDGSLDSTFNGTGTLLVAAGPTSRPRAIGVHPNGTIVAVGTGRRPNPPSTNTIPTWARLTINADGSSPLVAFGQSLPTSSPGAARIYPDGSAVLAAPLGNASGGTDVWIVKLRPDGSLDPAFNGTGSTVIAPHERIDASDGDTFPVAVDVDSRGGVLIGGGSGPIPAGSFSASGIIGGASTTAWVARVNSDGTPDTGFGNGGVTVIDPAQGHKHVSANVFASHLLTLASGRTLVSGVSGGTTYVAQLTEGTDSHAGVVGLMPFDYPATEQFFAPITARVRRTGGSGGAVSVDYALVGGSATAGTDFTPAQGQLSWAAGDYSDRSIDLTIADDADQEPVESFDVVLSNLTGGARLGVSRVTAEIVDNDTPKPIPFITLRLRLAESDHLNVFDVFRDPADPSSGFDMEVTYTLGAGTATNNLDFELDPAAQTRWLIPMSDNFPILFPLVNDTTDEADETFVWDVRTDTNGLIRTGTFTVVITDDDEPARNGQIAFVQAATSANESSGTVTLTARRSEGSDDAVSATFAVSGGTATAGSDFTLAGGTVSWVDGEIGDKQISITVNNDATDEPDETIVVSLSAPTNGATLGAPSSSTVTLIDDDPAPTPPPGGGGGGGGGGGSGRLDSASLALLLALFAGLRRRVRHA